MKKPILLNAAAFGVAAASVALWGCPNPNDIGVQTFGVVQVTCLQASNNQPVPGALASVDGAAPVNTSGSGVAIVPNVPVGANEPVHCDAAGLTGISTVNVTANNTASSPATVTVSMSPP